MTVLEHEGLAPPLGHQGTVFHFSPWGWWLSPCESSGLVAPIGARELRKRNLSRAYV